MLYVFHALDKPSHLHVRKANTEAHIEHIKNSPSAKLVLAGPLLGEDNVTVVGSMLVFEAEHEDAAQAFLKNDPYTKAELFAESRLSAWRKTFGWQDA